MQTETDPGDFASHVVLVYDGATLVCTVHVALTLAADPAAAKELLAAQFPHYELIGEG